MISIDKALRAFRSVTESLLGELRAYMAPYAEVLVVFTGPLLWPSLASNRLDTSSQREGVGGGRELQYGVRIIRAEEFLHIHVR
jgi:hypothetical protein